MDPADGFQWNLADDLLLESKKHRIDLSAQNFGNLTNDTDTNAPPTNATVELVYQPPVGLTASDGFEWVAVVKPTPAPTPAPPTPAPTTPAPTPIPSIPEVLESSMAPATEETPGSLLQQLGMPKVLRRLSEQRKLYLRTDEKF